MKTKNNHGMRLMAVTVTIMLLTAMSWSSCIKRLPGSDQQPRSASRPLMGGNLHQERKALKATMASLPPDKQRAMSREELTYTLTRTAKGVKAQEIRHFGYLTCWNSDWLIPNWVAYSLNPRKVAGIVKRPKRQFDPDPQVKGRSAEHSDYTHSGYSRGHMAPAADMKWSERAMNESFYLSNVCPQVQAMNGGVWEHVERKCRQLAKETEIFICTGPIMGKRPERIGRNGVAVPERFFKVVCMQRNGKWQAIGFVVPNSDCRGSMFRYACSVDQVEALTGHDFFYELPDSIENKIEAAWGTQADWQ